jgi:hypothetical protein
VSFTNSSDSVFDLPRGAIFLAQAVSRLGAASKGKGQRSGEGESFNAALHNHANLRFLHLTNKAPDSRFKINSALHRG